MRKNISSLGAPKTRLLIVDQSLRDLNGHHYDYDNSVAAAASAKGLSPIIAAHLEFDRSLAEGGVVIKPVFRHTWNEVNRSHLKQGVHLLLASLPHKWSSCLVKGISSLTKRLSAANNQSAVHEPDFVSFGQELLGLVASENLEAWDHVFIHTLAISELHAVIAAFKENERMPHFHFVLRRDAEEPTVREDPWGGVAGAFRAIDANDAIRRKFSIYADTKELCIQYEALHDGIKVNLLPIPHELPFTVDPCESKRSSEPLILTYLGNARTEKGFHHLPGLVKALNRSSLVSSRVKFVIQANSSMSLEEGVIQNARKQLAAYKQDNVQLLLGPLSSTEFRQHLFEADIVLMPYQAELYQRRSSGIMVQAIAAGRPVVVPANSWMANAAPPGTCVTYDGADDLPRACMQAIEKIENLRQAVCEAGEEWRKLHNGARLVDVLLADK